MKNLKILIFLLLIFLASNNASPLKKKPTISKLYMPTGRPFYGLFPGGIADPKKVKGIISETFTQKVDHFDDSNTATYEQVRS